MSIRTLGSAASPLVELMFQFFFEYSSKKRASGDSASPPLTTPGSRADAAFLAGTITSLDTVMNTLNVTGVADVRYTYFALTDSSDAATSDPQAAFSVKDARNVGAKRKVPCCTLKSLIMLALGDLVSRRNPINSWCAEKTRTYKSHESFQASARRHVGFRCLLFVARSSTVSRYMRGSAFSELGNSPPSC